MKNIVEYKGYNAKIEYSTEDSCLYGIIIGITDSIIYIGWLEQRGWEHVG